MVVKICFLSFRYHPLCLNLPGMGLIIKNKSDLVNDVNQENAKKRETDIINNTN